MSELRTLQVGILNDARDRVAIQFPSFDKLVFLDYYGARTLGEELLALAEIIKPPPKDAA